MPSSKSVAKRSSSKSTHIIVNNKDYSTSLKLFIFILTCALNGSILYYLYNLEDVTCQCIRDWRHNFIKGMIVISIIMSLLSLFGVDLTSYSYIITIIFLLGFVQLYAMYTYINDLNASPPCSCALDNQPKLNYFMKGYVNFIYGMTIFFAIILVIGIIMITFNHLMH